MGHSQTIQYTTYSDDDMAPVLSSAHKTSEMPILIFLAVFFLRHFLLIGFGTRIRCNGHGHLMYECAAGLFLQHLRLANQSFSTHIKRACRGAAESWSHTLDLLESIVFRVTGREAAGGSRSRQSGRAAATTVQTCVVRRSLDFGVALLYC